MAIGREKLSNVRLFDRDAVLLVDAYHEFSHPYEMMQGIYKALKPGGRVILVEYRGEDPSVPIKPLHKMTEQQVVEEIMLKPMPKRQFITPEELIGSVEFLLGPAARAEPLVAQGRHDNRARVDELLVARPVEDADGDVGDGGLLRLGDAAQVLGAEQRVDRAHAPRPVVDGAAAGCWATWTGGTAGSPESIITSIEAARPAKVKSR